MDDIAAMLAVPGVFERLVVLVIRQQVAGVRDVTIQPGPDGAVVQVQFDGERQVLFNLEPIRDLAEAGGDLRRALAEIVRALLGETALHEAEDIATDSWGDVLGRLRTILVRGPLVVDPAIARQLGGRGRPQFIGSRWAGDVYQYAVLELVTGFVPVTTDLVARWGVTEDAVLEVGRANLEHAVRRMELRRLDPVRGLDMPLALIGNAADPDHRHAASAALCPDLLREWLPGHDRLVVLPLCDDVLLVGPEHTLAVFALGQLAEAMLVESHQALLPFPRILGADGYEEVG